MNLQLEAQVLVMMEGFPLAQQQSDCLCGTERFGSHGDGARVCSGARHLGAHRKVYSRIGIGVDLTSVSTESIFCSRWR